jgi:hypothetical protein
MPLFSDPLLVVWEAMNLLSQLRAYPDAPQIKALITDAETVLCRLTMELAREHNILDQDASQVNEIVLH